MIDFAKQEQKAAEYLKLNPDGKTPTIFERTQGRAVLGTGAILWHLAEKYGRFLSDDPVEQLQTWQWLLLQVGRVGQLMGQAMYFQRIAAPNGPEEPFAIKRYVEESRRMLEVLNARLAGWDYIVTDFSIADTMIFPWTRAYPWAGSEEGQPHPQFWDAVAQADEFLQENAARFAGDVKTE